MSPFGGGESHGDKKKEELSLDERLGTLLKREVAKTPSPRKKGGDRTQASSSGKERKNPRFLKEGAGSFPSGRQKKKAYFP